MILATAEGFLTTMAVPHKAHQWHPPTLHGVVEVTLTEEAAKAMGSRMAALKAVGCHRALEPAGKVLVYLVAHDHSDFEAS
jgi:hypothetical protein